MAYDEEMAGRIRAVLSDHPLAGDLDWDEISMFGGLCFMVNGHMTCGVTKDGIMVRVGRENYQEALAQPHAREMDFTGRPMAGMVYVAPEGVKSKAFLRKWVERGVRFTTSLPPKKKKTPRKKPHEKRRRREKIRPKTPSLPHDRRRTMKKATGETTGFTGFSRKTLGFLKGLRSAPRRPDFTQVF
ncbi:MAG: TfoX/Sxy family protein, partial [bacterium]